MTAPQELYAGYPNITVNRYGNVLVTEPETPTTPQPVFDLQHAIIFQKVSQLPSEVRLLSDHKTHGTLYASPGMLQIHPDVVDQEIRGAVTVILWRQDAGYRVVLVQDKNKNYLMNPGGWSTRGEEPAATAVRQVKLETGWEVKVGPPVAEWTFKNDFGQLEWMARSQGFVALLAQPPCDAKTTELPSPDSDIVSLKIMDVANLVAEMKNPNHHQELILGAVERLDPEYYATLTESQKPRTTTFGFLKSFTWLHS